MDNKDFSLKDAFCWVAKRAHDFYMKNTYSTLNAFDDTYSSNRENTDISDGLAITALSPIAPIIAKTPNSIKTSVQTLAVTGAFLGAFLGKLSGDGTLPLLLGGAMGAWTGSALPYAAKGLGILGTGGLAALCKPFAAVAHNHKEAVDKNAESFENYLVARKEAPRLE